MNSEELLKILQDGIDDILKTEAKMVAACSAYNEANPGEDIDVELQLDITGNVSESDVDDVMMAIAANGEQIH